MTQADYNRDYYEVVETIDGKKWIYFLGYTTDDIEDDDITTDWYYVSMSGVYIPVDEYSRDKLDIECGACTQYRDEVEDIATFYDDCKHLPLTKVTQDTPCGYYWCTFDEDWQEGDKD